MSARLLVCLIVCVGESTGSGGAVTQIAPGDDVSLSCPSSTGQDRWEGPQSSNTMRVNLNRTEYLLIKNFQVQNKGEYVCHNNHTKFELKDASSNDESVLFRTSEGDSLFLFCKNLLSTPLRAAWFWRPHHSDKTLTLGLNSTHFGKRLHFRNKDNDFSLNISSINWGDSGRYECQRSSQHKTFFELVVVRVHADPQQLTEGDDVTLQCNVSHHLPNTRLYWINMETQENFPNPHQLRRVTMGQGTWTCAVFNDSKLKALFPLTLNINQHLTTTTRSTPAPHYDNMGPGLPPKDFTLISVCTVFSFLLLVLIGAVCWRKKAKKRMESFTSVNDSITYAAVNVRQKSETPAVAFAEFSSISNSGLVEENEIIYSSVKLG
ncbi:uncharacterized protein LOC118820636 isoform X1 [Colossoma macropomum]|uniref:uncharacterized protein LOC118820636 isoform X1 n=1 Tax=Colossoma macropomum TaxID=42526 RepID=UPI001864A452|nr:uncharacterized protein LOC118820636 isoform X1 [Colossoma macropomum]